MTLEYSEFLNHLSVDNLIFLVTCRKVIDLLLGIVFVQLYGQHLDKFIRGADQGVILFSLGSLAGSRDLGVEARQIFQNVFAQIPQRIIWKYGEHIDGITDNVLISDWVPQQDILGKHTIFHRIISNNFSYLLSLMQYFHFNLQIQHKKM